MMRLLHTTAAPTGCASADYLELVEAVALQAAEVYSACEAYESLTLPTMVRVHAATLSDFTATLSEVPVIWSSSSDRHRISNELRSARTDLLGAFDLVSDRAPRLLPGYLLRVAGALSAVAGALRVVEAVLATVDRTFPAAPASVEAVGLEMAA